MRTVLFALLDKYPGPVCCTTNQHRLPVCQLTRVLLPLLIIKVKSVGVALPMKKRVGAISVTALSQPQNSSLLWGYFPDGQ